MAKKHVLSKRRIVARDLACPKCGRQYRIHNLVFTNVAICDNGHATKREPVRLVSECKCGRYAYVEGQSHPDYRMHVAHPFDSRYYSEARHP